jgi:hypothetical protein
METILDMIFIIALQAMSGEADYFIVNKPIVFQVEKHNANIKITKLKPPAEGYWNYKADLFIGNKLTKSLDAAGYYSEEGMLLFSLTNEKGDSLFGVNEAGAPLILKQMTDSIFLTADFSNTLVKTKEPELFYVGNTYEYEYGDGMTSITIIHKDFSISRVLYSIKIQTPQEVYLIKRSDK